MSDDLTWRWRVYVPAGNFACHLGGGGIPATGTKVTGGGSGTNAHAGEYTMPARVERNPLGKWTFTLSGPGFGQMVAILPEYESWLGGHSDRDIQESLRKTRAKVAGRRETESFSPDEPPVLLRLRALKPGQAAEEPSDGVMLWFEKGGRLPRGSSPPASPARTFRPR